MKTQKGITLIALIITIIVMLILVGVSVSVALNTGLFKTAQGAAKNTEGARVNETNLSKGKIQKEDGTWVDIKEYANSFKSEGLGLTGEIGSQVAYSAGGVDDWRIWKKDETEGTVTIVGQVGTFAEEIWNSVNSVEEFSNYLRGVYTDPQFEDNILNVEYVSLLSVIDLSRIN